MSSLPNDFLQLDYRLKNPVPRKHSNFRPMSSVHSEISLSDSESQRLRSRKGSHHGNMIPNPYDIPTALFSHLFDREVYGFVTRDSISRFTTIENERKQDSILTIHSDSNSEESTDSGIEHEIPLQTPRRTSKGVLEQQIPTLQTNCFFLTHPGNITHRHNMPGSTNRAQTFEYEDIQKAVYKLKRSLEEMKRPESVQSRQARVLADDDEHDDARQRANDRERAKLLTQSNRRKRVVVETETILEEYRSGVRDIDELLHRLQQHQSDTEGISKQGMDIVKRNARMVSQWSVESRQQKAIDHAMHVRTITQRNREMMKDHYTRGIARIREAESRHQQPKSAPTYQNST